MLANVGNGLGANAGRAILATLKDAENRLLTGPTIGLRRVAVRTNDAHQRLALRVVHVARLAADVRFVHFNVATELAAAVLSSCIASECAAA